MGEIGAEFGGAQAIQGSTDSQNAGDVVRWRWWLGSIGCVRQFGQGTEAGLVQQEEMGGDVEAGGEQLKGGEARVADASLQLGDGGAGDAGGVGELVLGEVEGVAGDEEVLGRRWRRGKGGLLRGCRREVGWWVVS